MKILILGSTGILGRTLCLFLSQKKNIIIQQISRNKENKKHIFLNDFTNFKKLEKIILEINPTHIINCLGITKFNESYNDKKNLYIINGKLPKFLAKLCLKKNFYFLHISTDCVFSGSKGNYMETSIKDSIDSYGKSKSIGEVKNKFTSTIRTSFIGPELKTKKSLLAWFLKQRKRKIDGYTHAFFSGLTSLELSNIIYKFFVKNKFFYNKIVNIGGPKISKYSLLNIISIVFKKNIIINKYSSFKIDRTLNISKFLKISKYKTKSWITMLKELKKFMDKNKFKF
jgi:dTDP-4-dehydrorhamnose reductase